MLSVYNEIKVSSMFRINIDVIECTLMLSIKAAQSFIIGIYSLFIIGYV